MEAPLVLVPTPIGNLADMTYRGVEVLRSCDEVLCEDTRVTGKLLKHYEVSKPMRAFHAHNEHKKVEEITSELRAGKRFALVTDAGMPGISDPAFLLVRSCVDAGIEVECLPGATAVIPALVVSGLPCDKFAYEGFLPHKKGRKKRIGELVEETRTIVFFESPYRLVKLLYQLSEQFGPNRMACVCRELSKLHEEHKRGSLEDLAEYYEANQPKGEIVVVVAGKED